MEDNISLLIIVISITMVHEYFVFQVRDIQRQALGLYKQSLQSIHFKMKRSTVVVVYI